MFNVAVRNRIKEVLKEKGTTPYLLSQKMGKHSNHLYVLAKREILDDVTIKTLADIAAALGVPVDHLYTVEPDKK